MANDYLLLDMIKKQQHIASFHQNSRKEKEIELVMAVNDPRRPLEFLKEAYDQMCCNTYDSLHAKAYYSSPL